MSSKIFLFPNNTYLIYFFRYFIDVSWHKYDYGFKILSFLGEKSFLLSDLAGKMGHSVNEKSTLFVLSLMWQMLFINLKPKKSRAFQHYWPFFSALLSLVILSFNKKCGFWDAVMFPAGAHTLNAVYFVELMAASLNQHVGGWRRGACTPKFIWFPFRGCAVH